MGIKGQAVFIFFIGVFFFLEELCHFAVINAAQSFECDSRVVPIEALRGAAGLCCVFNGSCEHAYIVFSCTCTCVSLIPFMHFPSMMFLSVLRRDSFVLVFFYCS